MDANRTKKVTVIERERVKKDYSVGIYARVSTNSREQLNSLAAQVSGLTRLAAAHMTWFVADVFIDIGTAKTGSSRVKFERMIRACEHNAIDIVLTKSISRFGRDTLETLEAVRRIKEAGKRIIFEREQIDTESIDSEMLISIITACEQSENEWRSENIRWGLKRAAELGTSGLYNRACYGYKKDAHGMLMIVEEQAETVCKIYDWYLEGASVLGIINMLERCNIKSPTGKNKWNKRSVEKILQNRKYTGDVAIADSGNSSQKYLYEEHHEGIISKEKYEAVQLEMVSRSNIELTENGIKRKHTKYSSKKKKM